MSKFVNNVQPFRDLQAVITPDPSVPVRQREALQEVLWGGGNITLMYAAERKDSQGVPYH